ncbi:lysine N(6)-hydroxylase/L-ornithine N(5)-oxygenase family protein [Flocculibacter collagenilyticus]|uniref:lysine N(6)-hydroxylase/L-ornithine N(5)-oxygenase family protein n=1 Tax=Flocculibacter collagenilyticus TaxID=2744479 RepID=UPI0018F6E11C|nr:SidA/IucD/PvdA family monooxygenase [Flocculibacter collagenilyticus]
MTTQPHCYDLLGIGAGPFNLSIAALSATKPELSTLFLERKPQFSWHPGLLLEQSKMQTSFVKDMVTCVDPTNPYSFMNYLVKTKKVYPFLASDQSVISRLEFSDYMAWVAAQLPSVQLNSNVESIQLNNGVFEVATDTQQYRTKHLVVGTGVQPNMPEFARPHVSTTCFHASELQLRAPDLSGKRVAIIGGGQTGADVFGHAFNGQFGHPKQITWVSRRANIESLDEGCFSDNYFMPDYVNGFYHLDQSIKDREVSRQKLTSDGITSACLKELYQQLYHDRYVLRKPAWWTIQPNRSLTGMLSNSEGYQLEVQHGQTHHVSHIHADIVIFCTGFERCIPQCLKHIEPSLTLADLKNPSLTPDFYIKNYADQISHSHGSDNRIYMVNAGKSSHGIAEPQLSLAAWRAAKIINSVHGSDLYQLAEEENLIDWGLPSQDLAANAELTAHEDSCAVHYM